MGVKYGFCQCAGFEQGETEDNGVGCKGEYRAMQIVRYTTTDSPASSVLKKFSNFQKGVLLRHTEKSAQPSIYKGYAVFTPKLEVTEILIRIYRLF